DAQVASRKSARNTQCAHGGFGPRVHQADHFHGRDRLANQLRQFDLPFRGSPKARSDFQSLAKRFDYFRMAMSEQQGPPGPDVIDIALAVLAGEPCAVATPDKAWHAANTAKCAHWRIHTAGNNLFCALEENFRSLRAHLQAPCPWGITCFRNMFMNTSPTVPC